MFAREATKRGVKNFTPIRVAPHVTAKGRFVVQGDGNNRVAFLKLAGFKGKIAVRVAVTRKSKTAVQRPKKAR